MAGNMRKPVFIPPGGYAGFSQQTQAVQGLLRKKTGVARTRRTTKKKRVVKKRAPARRRTAAKKRTPGRKARMVKGSAAAKAHMAKLRRMRKK